MPVSVKEIFDHVGCKVLGPWDWNTRIPIRDAGVYVISLCADSHICAWSSAPRFSREVLEAWINYCTDMRLVSASGAKEIPTARTLGNYLASYMMSGECILYIGKGNNLQKRVGQYYRTLLGRAKPHSGGQWLKAIEEIEKCAVFVGKCRVPEEAEQNMLRYFSKNAGKENEICLPFANLELKRAGRRLRKQTRLIRQRN